MPKRKAILHIGTAKTGSTTIQRLLAGRRDALIADGFAYPRAPGRNNHMLLAVCGAEPQQASRMARVLGEREDVTVVLEKLRRDLDAELGALPASVHTVIFSNEHCYAKIDSPEAAARLKAFLDPWFDSFEVLAYLRRQDEFAVSRYTTRLRAGGFEVSVLPAANAEFNADDDDEDSAEDQDLLSDLADSTTQSIGNMLDWSKTLDNWAGAFGKAALRPRIFDRREFVGNDLVLDFLHCCGLPADYAKDARTHNTSMRPEAQEFLRRYNEMRHNLAAATGAKTIKVPAPVKAVLQREYSGGGRLPLRSEVEAFMARFAEANERLRAIYFPDRQQVFSTDFSKYPTVAEPLPSDAAVLEVALHVLVGGKGGAPSAAEEAFRRGEGHVAANRRNKAIEAFREALGHDPTFNKARRALRALERPAKPGQREEQPSEDGRSGRGPADRPQRAAAERERVDRPEPAAERRGDRPEPAAERRGDREEPAAERRGDRGDRRGEKRPGRPDRAAERRAGRQPHPDLSAGPGSDRRHPEGPGRGPAPVEGDIASGPAGSGSGAAPDKPKLTEAERAARRARREERARLREGSRGPGD